MGNSFDQVLENVRRVRYIGFSHLINLLQFGWLFGQWHLGARHTWMPRLLEGSDTLARPPDFILNLPLYNKGARLNKQAKILL